MSPRSKRFITAALLSAVALSIGSANFASAKPLSSTASTLPACPTPGGLPEPLSDVLARLLQSPGATVQKLDANRTFDGFDWYEVNGHDGLVLQVQVKAGESPYNQQSLRYVSRLGDNYLQNETFQNGVRVRSAFGIGFDKFHDRHTGKPLYTEARLDPASGRLLSESGWLMTENFNVVRQFRAKFNGNGKLTDYRTARANMYRTYSPFKPTKCLD